MAPQLFHILGEQIIFLPTVGGGGSSADIESCLWKLRKAIGAEIGFTGSSLFKHQVYLGIKIT